MSFDVFNKINYRSIYINLLENKPHILNCKSGLENNFILKTLN